MNIKLSYLYRLSVFAVFGLMGCASQYAWVNLKNNTANYYVDLYECSNEANDSVLIFNASDYVAPPVVNVGPDSNRACSNIDASTVNCFSATPQNPIPLTAKQQFGEDDHQKFIDTCMGKRGWFKKKK